MRFTALQIRNFKAIEAFEVAGLTDFVLIAGPNGCGKSCVLDAIRLLKSAYGGYQANEWMQWFGEFGINLNDRQQVDRLFRDPLRSVEILAKVELSEQEREFLSVHAESVLEPIIWSELTGQPHNALSFNPVAIATQFRQFGREAHDRVEDEADRLRESLSAECWELSLVMAPGGPITPAPNRTMEVIFQTYAPEHIGVVEYHSASRTYQRENVGGVNLDARNLEAQRMQQTLYNWQSKYNNVKTELATTYLRELIAREAGVDAGTSDLNATLKELFQTFFPDKEYLGVVPNPNGGLDFPVRLRTGQEHDINELSSGEKEVLYGYLRLRNSTPNHSTILLDEPELHLNPALLRGFPDFYHRHLGRARGNQLWLVTHSDTLLRQAVGNPNYSVFHMSVPGASDGMTNQAMSVVADDELERATIDLVGDLATYRPKSKVVLFEGGGDTEFDVLLTQRLFPEVARAVNLLSGGGKRRVRDLYDVLARAAEQVGMADRFYCITDKDSATWEIPDRGARQLSWDVYHIENYLLEPGYVRAAADAVTAGTALFRSDEEVAEALHLAAETLVPALTVERLRTTVNHRIISSVNLGADPAARDAAAALLPSIVGSYRRLDDVRAEVSKREWLEVRARELEAALQASLAGSDWLKEFLAVRYSASSWAPIFAVLAMRLSGTSSLTRWLMTRTSRWACVTCWTL